MTKIFNFALKIKGVLGRVAHAKSSDPGTPQKYLKRAPVLIGLTGCIGEIIGFHRSLKDQEILYIHKYLIKKWGIADTIVSY